MMEQKYLVKISTPNFILNFRGKIVRSPVELIAFERELNLIKIQCKSRGAVPIISFYDPTVRETKISEEEIISMAQEPIVEELYSKKPKTILEKLMHNQSIENEGIQDEKNSDISEE
jgi:hypothetical protein